jgi:hypothetical protein
MAINKSVAIQRIEVHPAESGAAENTNASKPWMLVVSEITFTGTGQDTSDVDLPMTDTISKNLYYYSDEANQTQTSLAGEDALVQSVGTAIWS